MPSVGYATLQVIPSMRGIGADIRRQLDSQLGPVGRQLGQQVGDDLGDGLYRGADGRLRDLRGRFAAEGRQQGRSFGQEASSGVSKTMLAGLAGIAAGAGAVLVQGLQEAMGQLNAASTLQAQLGTTNKVAAAQGKVAGKLFGSGVSGSFQEAADAIKAVVQAGLAPPDATNAQLQRIATKAADVSKVFGQDLGGVTNAVSQLMRTGLAKNSSQAFDLITRGFQTGTDKGGDFLDTINEYGTQFRKAGLTGQTAIGLLNQAIRAGARDSDVAADAIKEFSIRAVDGSKSSVAGFQALGLNADTMASKFAKGGKSANGVLDITLDKLRGIKDPVKQSQIAVQLFGTQAEDLGSALLAMDPSKAASGLGKVGGAASKMGKTLRSGPSHEIEVFKRAVSQTFVTFLGGTVLPVIARVGAWVNSNLVPPLRTAASVVGSVLGPAFSGIGSAISGTVGWLQKFGVWLIPVGVAVAGLTLTMAAQRIATAATTAVFAIYRGVLMGWMVIQRGATAAQVLFNAALRANPIGLIITAIVALVAVFVIAYNRVGWFRTAVNAVWSAIKIGAAAVWVAIKVAFNGIITAIQAVGRFFVWLWGYIKPVLSGIWMAVKIMATIIVTIFMLTLWPVIKAVGTVFKWLYNNAVKPAAGWIAGKVAWLVGRVKLYWALFKQGLTLLGLHFKRLYYTYVFPVVRWIAQKVMWVVNKAKQGWALFKLGLTILGNAFKRLYNTYVRPIMAAIGAKIKAVWNGLIKPAFNAVKAGVKLVGVGFSKAKDAIKAAWSKIAGIAKKPIAFIINTVYNKGIVPVWNKVAGAFGAPKLAKAKGFATGGYTGDGAKYTPAGIVHAGEFVTQKSSTASIERTHPGALDYMNRTGRMPGFSGGGLVGSMPGFAKGGLVGSGWGWIKNAASSAWDKVKQGASWIKETIKGSAQAGLNKLVKPLIARISGSASVYKSMVTKVPKKMVSSIFNWSGTADKKLAAAGIVGGGGYKSAQRWAKTQNGKRYQWGGNGNPSWDCSGYMSAIESVIRGQKPHRRWATGAFPPGTPGWRRNARSPFMIGITNAGVGHTAGTINGTNVESSGGGVKYGGRARGYRNGMFTSRWGFTGKYDQGGWLQPGVSTVMNATGQPEAVLTGPQWRVAQAAMAQPGGLQAGDEMRLIVDGHEFHAYVDTRARGQVRQENAQVLTALGARPRR